jgi:hypothetical protein
MMSGSKCAACGHRKKPLAPMLHDKVWKAFAAAQETLCAACFYRRTIDRDVRVTLADLLPCPFNLFGAPQSWFDLFRSIDGHPGSAILNQWRVEAWKVRAWPEIGPHLWAEL